MRRIYASWIGFLSLFSSCLCAFVVRSIVESWLIACVRHEPTKSESVTLEFEPGWKLLPKKTIDQFDEQGYLIVRNAIDPATIQCLLDASDRLLESESKNSRQTRDDGHYDGFRNCLALDDAFIPLLMHETVFPMMVQFLGAYIQLVTSHLIYKHPDPAGSDPARRHPNWHRDYGRLTNDLGHAAVPRAMIKCTYYLTDLTQPNSGQTLVVPGSNLLREGLDIPDGGDPEGALEPQLEPGDCLLFENRTWHAGGVNLSSEARKVVMFGYGYRWTAPIDYRIQPDALLAKVSPMGRYLLGETMVETDEYQTSGGETPLRGWCEANDLPLVRPPRWGDE